ncbi:Tn7-like element transposition protein TnsE [Staphylococcus pseudintermedius]|uniref:Tn7-like element transposition protein TnsE n=1 Tax=Staphylococcus pseudintermedius TaxID=283734 RepID=UPI002ED8DF68
MVDGKRKFTYLDDGVTNRQYAVTTINLFNDKQYRVVEVERESRSLSMLILSSDLAMDWDNVLEELLLNLVNDSGTWLKSSLEHIEKKDIIVKKAKHSKKNFEHRAKLLCEKLI